MVHRFIPTRAGKIISSYINTISSPVHPHSRGENCGPKLRPVLPLGSSPLARGKFSVEWSFEEEVRFIPTRAGKIRSYGAAHPHEAVHPHSRGENWYFTRSTSVYQGSSPLARGKCDWVLQKHNTVGFIPTRAGKIITVSMTKTTGAVHPHSRGENGNPAHADEALAGSSPLARGKFPAICFTFQLVGFIPTRAGKIDSSDKSTGASRVHPHSRGENRTS